MTLNPTKPLENVIASRHILAFKLIDEKVSSRKNKTVKSRSGPRFNSLESRIDKFCDLSPDKILEMVKKGVLI